MNTTTPSSLSARNPQYAMSRKPRMFAALAAVVVTVVLFEGVALLGGHDNTMTTIDVNAAVVAQASGDSVTR